jgi:hypothetical protein
MINNTSGAGVDFDVLSRNRILKLNPILHASAAKFAASIFGHSFHPTYWMHFSVGRTGIKPDCRLRSFQ